MKLQILDILRCPETGARLDLISPQYDLGEVETGELATADRRFVYPIRDFIPRFVPETSYADNFGVQWNRFRQTQLDSFSGQPISADRFWNATGWRPVDLAGKWVLDVGCGAGRFAELALESGANVLALDYSSAVDACYANLKHFPNLHVVQANIYALPLLQGVFPFVYSLGVLQHTPDVERAFQALPPMLAPNGELCVDFYWKRIRTMMHAKFVWRPFTKRVPNALLFRTLEGIVPSLLAISQFTGRVPLMGRYLKRLLPVADYTGIYPLSADQLSEWALLDTFDMLAPKHDNPQTAATVKTWLQNAGLAEIEVFHERHLVARGRKLS